MSIQMKCPNAACTTVLTVKEEFAGKTIKCPSCGAQTIVPSSITEPAGGGAYSNATPIPPEMASQPSTFMETVWALSDKNGLDRKAQLALMAGLAALVFLLFALLFPRYTEKITDLANNAKVLRDEWYWWLGWMIGGAFFFVTVLEIVFVVVSFAKMHVFLRYSFFGGAAWGALLSGFLFLYMVITAISGGDKEGMRYEYGIGLGTYMAFLGAIIVLATFGFLSYPEVMKLIKKQPQPAMS
jgi:hypothetical protein